jgi:hypothetical protein
MDGNGLENGSTGWLRRRNGYSRLWNWCAAWANFTRGTRQLMATFLEKAKRKDEGDARRDARYQLNVRSPALILTIVQP